MFVVVLDVPGAPHNEIIGPFETDREALAFEDRYVDAPAGSRAHILPVVGPYEYRMRSTE